MGKYAKPDHEFDDNLYIATGLIGAVGVSLVVVIGPWTLIPVGVSLGLAIWGIIRTLKESN